MGITYGYVLPVGRRWILEFSLGVGYIGGMYYEYNRSTCADGYPVRSRKERIATQASPSCMWLKESKPNKTAQTGATANSVASFLVLTVPSLWTTCPTSRDKLVQRLGTGCPTTRDSKRY
ncbi:MAG: DUF3575 domain-containing protein [Prevotellaceae bacterium]|nr:DUF3575 domain-containing protein [Prevotellaceae bacterium]